MGWMGKAGNSWAMIPAEAAAASSMICQTSFHRFAGFCDPGDNLSIGRRYAPESRAWAECPEENRPAQASRSYIVRARQDFVSSNWIARTFDAFAIQQVDLATEQIGQFIFHLLDETKIGKPCGYAGRKSRQQIDVAFLVRRFFGHGTKDFQLFDGMIFAKASQSSLKLVHGGSKWLWTEPCLKIIQLMPSVESTPENALSAKKLDVSCSQQRGARRG